MHRLSWVLVGASTTVAALLTPFDPMSGWAVGDISAQIPEPTSENPTVFDIIAHGGAEPAAGARLTFSAPQAPQGPADRGEASPPAGPRRTCGLFETTNDVAPLVAEVPGVRVGFEPVSDPVDGAQYASRCQTEGEPQPDIGLVTYDAPEPAPQVVPQDVAVEAYERVPLVAPVVQTSPPVGAPQLVGFPTWLWVDGARWRTFDATAEVPGLSVTVTATPRQVVWDMGDGHQVTCEGPGTPWVEGGSDTTDCDYTYQFTGTYTVTATITWGVSWTAQPTGETGTLADATRTGTAELTVSERQAVIRHG